MAKRPVTLADIVAGHVSLEIEGSDRICLNGWVPALQTPGQVEVVALTISDKIEAWLTMEVSSTKCLLLQQSRP